MNETHINHEVRLQVMEKTAITIDSRFDKIDAHFDRLEGKMDAQFYTLVGVLLTSLILPILLKRLGWL